MNIKEKITSFFVTGVLLSYSSLGYAGVTEMSAGGMHSLAIQKDGSLWAWGDNVDGQLGLGDNEDRTIPTQVRTEQWRTLAAGLQHSLGIQEDGSLWAWGSNEFGQLAQEEEVTESNEPLQVGTATDWLAVAAGLHHTLALTHDGKLWAWGDNERGQLGNGSFAHSTIPLVIQETWTWKMVSAGGYHSLGIQEDGTLWAWGSNTSGQLAQEEDIAESNEPLQLGTENDWLMVSAGGQHSLGIRSDGSLWAWGENLEGQLGIESNIQQNIPVQVGIEKDWLAVSAGDLHSLALKKDGTLWAWGDNSDGQLGNDTTIDSAIPVSVSGTWYALQAGAYHNLAMKHNGSLWAWGANWKDQIGAGTEQEQYTLPVEIIPSTKNRAWLQSIYQLLF